MKAALQEIRLSSVTALDSSSEPESVRDLRAHAAARFNELGLPTPRLEAWKYTNLAPVAKADFRLASRDVRGSAVEHHGFSFTGIAVAELVFVNGRLASELPAELPAGVRIRALSEALSDPAIAALISSEADIEEHAMTALNMALTKDGAVIEIAPGVAIDGFIHVLHVGEAEDEPVMSHPRNLVVAGENSQIGIVESYVGSGVYFTNAVTEVFARAGAVVDHTRIECESLQAFHVGTVQIRQERSSSVTARSFAIGGALVRNEANGILAGEGASLTLDGLYAATGTQHIDNYTVIDHTVPRCDSNEVYKGILDQSSRGIFSGLIIVRPGAEKTNSRQTNKNLVLSEQAIADSKPNLEIYNDDVKCSHGSTIGQLEDEPLFYLRSRGIGEEEARSLLVHAFASEVVDRIRFEPVREQVRRVLFRNLADRLPERRGGAR